MFVPNHLCIPLHVIVLVSEDMFVNTHLFPIEINHWSNVTKFELQVNGIYIRFQGETVDTLDIQKHSFGKFSATLDRLDFG